MTDETLDHILNHFLTQFKTIHNDQSTDLQDKLTFAQYKNLAQSDVDVTAKVLQGIENYLTDHLEVLKLEEELKRKKCALATSLKALDERFEEARKETNKRNEKLKTGDFEWLQPKSATIVDKKEQKFEFVKPAEPCKSQLPVEPVYSTRVMREKAVQPSVLESIMKPPTFSSSIKFETKKIQERENLAVNSEKQFDLDDSLINEQDLSIMPEDSRRRLKFDEDVDEEGDKTPARNVRKPQVKPLDLSSMPPPPVFTSNLGKVFNQK